MAGSIGGAPGGEPIEPIKIPDEKKANTKEKVQTSSLKGHKITYSKKTAATTKTIPSSLFKGAFAAKVTHPPQKSLADRNVLNLSKEEVKAGPKAGAPETWNEEELRENVTSRATEEEIFNPHEFLKERSDQVDTIAPKYMKE